MEQNISKKRDSRDKFVELANKRVTRVIKDLRLVGNLSNRRIYEYTEEDAKKILKGIADNLRKHKRMRVEVAGHTDNIGSAEINSQLSLQRARAATQFLMELGIKKDVLTTRGYAANQPVASNDTEAGRSANRRVEMRFIEID